MEGGRDIGEASMNGFRFMTNNQPQQQQQRYQQSQQRCWWIKRPKSTSCLYIPRLRPWYCSMSHHVRGVEDAADVMAEVAEGQHNSLGVRRGSGGKLQERHVVERDARIVEALHLLAQGRRASTAATPPPAEVRGRAVAEGLFLDVGAVVGHVRPAAAARGHGRQLGREAELVHKGVDEDHLRRAALDDQVEFLERFLELGRVGRVHRDGDDARPQAAEEHREEAQAEVEGQHDAITFVHTPLHPQEVSDLNKGLGTERMLAGAGDKLGRFKSRDA